MKRSSIVAGLAMLCACTDRELPLAPTPVAGPTIVVVQFPFPVPTPPQGVLQLELPRAGEFGPGFSLRPFGYHSSDHAETGHAGWDFAFGINEFILAAASGTVEALVPDPVEPTRTLVMLDHVVDSHHYRTSYTNLIAVASDVVSGASIRVGQPLGTPGPISRRIANTLITYRMTHFQVDDFEHYRSDVPNPNAVSPEPFLSPQAKFRLERGWLLASYPEELVEPFVTNPLPQTFPLSRTWIRAGGNGPPGIRFTRRAATSDQIEYALLTESRTAVEQGTVILSPASGIGHYSRIELVSGTGRRQGAYSIRSDEMRLTLVDPGSSPPIEPSASDVYRTTR